LSRRGVAQLLICLACGGVVLEAAPAQAQNPAAAEALFEQGRAAMAAGSYDIACARFRDSDKLDPAVGTRFNLADCEERRGRLATAWSLFRGVASELPSGDDRRPIAEQRAQQLAPRLPKVTLLRTPETPPELRVRIDGVELGEGSFGVPLPMDPGSHDLTLLRAAGAAPQTVSFALKEGEHSELPLTVASDVSESRGAEPVTLDRANDSTGARRRWAYIAAGVGLGGVALGTVTGIVTLNKKATADANCSNESGRCNPAGVDANESGKTYAALSGVGFGIGVVGLAVGTYLWLTSSAHSSAPSTTAAELAPELYVHSDSGFVSVAGRF
jgi:hypothetical protein